MNKRGAEVWSAFSAAIQESVAAFNQRYNPLGQPVEYTTTNKHRLVVSRTTGQHVDAAVRTMEAVFDLTGRQIMATCEHPDRTIVYRIDVTEDEQQRVFLTRLGGQEISYDAVSQELLEPLLFGNGSTAPFEQKEPIG